METTCKQCHSRYRLTQGQLLQAQGQVRCGECGNIFNALDGIKDHSPKLSLNRPEMAELEQPDSSDQTRLLTDVEVEHSAKPSPALSLHEAMYGTERRHWFTLGPVGWFIGILLLTAVGIAQAIYYQRYQLIEKPRFQQQVLNLCQLLPCAESGFSSTEQIRLLERNVFTHPVVSKALMVSGSYVNQAPFAQKLPNLLISLFDVQGKLIANRLFKPVEYLLEDKNRRLINSGITVQFRLEILDPGTDALTYEFEFY